MKKNAKNFDQEFIEMLHACDRQCQMEFRLARTTSFGRCPERHMETSKNPDRKGPCQLTFVQMGDSRAKKLFCQWCARTLVNNLQYSNEEKKRATIIDHTQTDMFTGAP